MLAPVRRGPLVDTPSTIFGWAVTSWYGGRVDPLTGRPGNHGGMDLAFNGCTGQDMIVVEGGTLAQSWDRSGGGWWSGLTTDSGDYWGYGHAQDYAPPFDNHRGGVRRVEAGEVLAFVGTSGGSTGPHLHCSYRPRGSFVYQDPYDKLRAAASLGAPTPPPPEKDWFDMADKQDVIDAVNGAFAAHPPIVVSSGAHPVCQINDQLWYITEDDGVVKRRWISGPTELRFLQQAGVVQTGPHSNLTAEVEGAFYATERLPIDASGNVGPADAPGGA